MNQTLRNRFFFVSLLPILCASLFLSFSCGRQESVFDRFRSAIEQIIAEAEEQKMDRLQVILHPDFNDQDGRDAGRILAWLESLLKTRRDVVVHLLDIEGRAHPTPESEGEVRLDIVVSSGGLKMVRKLVSFYGRLVRIRLFVEGEVDWTVTAAEWQEINMADLGAEALDRFQALFPGAGRSD